MSPAYRSDTRRFFLNSNENSAAHHMCVEHEHTVSDASPGVCIRLPFFLPSFCGFTNLSAQSAYCTQHWLWSPVAYALHTQVAI